MGLFKGILRAVIAVPKALIVFLMIALLALNVATVAIGSVATVVATAYEFVTGSKAVITILKDDIRVKDRNIASLKKSVAAKNKRIASLTDDVAKLKASKYVQYRGQKKLLSEAVEDTTSRVSKRIAKGSARNVASMFGESLPFFGVAVIAVVTGWELRDSCVMMKDLHELDVAFNPENASLDGATEVCGIQVPRAKEIVAKIVNAPKEAWGKAQEAVPGVPDLPENVPPELKKPEWDWTPWN